MKFLILSLAFLSLFPATPVPADVNQVSKVLEQLLGTNKGKSSTNSLDVLTNQQSGRPIGFAPKKTEIIEEEIIEERFNDFSESQAESTKHDIPHYHKKYSGPYISKGNNDLPYRNGEKYNDHYDGDYEEKYNGEYSNNKFYNDKYSDDRYSNDNYSKDGYSNEGYKAEESYNEKYADDHYEDL